MTDAKTSLLDLINTHSKAGKWWSDSHFRGENWDNIHAISNHLTKNGFDDLEFLGHGSYALVVAPKNNSNIVLRICTSLPNERAVMPYMLQRIGHEEIHTGDWCISHDANGTRNALEEYHTIEALKRLDMNVPREDLNIFLSEAERHGNRIGSLGRGSEIGWYSCIAADGSEKKVLMGADPSALSKRGKELTHEPTHPSLADQRAENLRLAKADPRLAHYIQPLTDLELPAETAIARPTPIVPPLSKPNIPEITPPPEAGEILHEPASTPLSAASLKLESITEAPLVPPLSASEKALITPVLAAPIEVPPVPQIEPIVVAESKVELSHQHTLVVEKPSALASIPSKENQIIGKIEQTAGKWSHSKMAIIGGATILGAVIAGYAINEWMKKNEKSQQQGQSR